MLTFNVAINNNTSFDIIEKIAAQLRLINIVDYSNFVNQGLNLCLVTVDNYDIDKSLFDFILVTKFGLVYVIDPISDITKGGIIIDRLTRVKLKELLC